MAILTAQKVILELAFDESGFIVVTTLSFTTTVDDRGVHMISASIPFNYRLPLPPITSTTMPCLARVSIPYKTKDSPPVYYRSTTTAEVLLTPYAMEHRLEIVCTEPFPELQPIEVA